MLRYTLVHLVEPVGEAAAHVEPSIKELAPEIPWPQIIRTRNRLIHGYDYIDYEVLWEIVNKDLPPLLEDLENLLAKR